MKFNSSILISTFVGILVYFIINTIMYMSLDSSRDFLDVLSKQIIIIVSLLASGIILSILFNNQNNQTQRDENQTLEDTVSDISHNIMFSTPPFDIRLANALHKIKKLMGSEAIYVGVYQKNCIQILSQESNISELFLERTISYNSCDDNLSIDIFSSQQDLIVNFYQEDKEKDIKTLKLKDSRNLESFIIALKPKSSIKSFGLLCVVMPNKYIFTKKAKNYLHFLANSIAFATNIHLKKDAILQANIRYYKQHNEIDEELNIYNQNKIEKTIDTESERHKRYLTPLSLVFFGIDDLDKISKIMSPHELLSIKQSFASLIKENTRTTDIFGIYENNLFVIIAPNTDYQGTNVMVDKISSIIKKQSFYRISNLTCSFGITAYSPKDTPALFKSRAKNAMEKAKQKGGNRAEIQLLV